MTQHTKSDLIKHHGKEYRKASKRRKSQILDTLAELTGYTRKHLIHALRGDLDIPKEIKRDRRSPYEPVKAHLEKLWAASNFLCGRRLAPFLPEMLDALKRHGEVMVDTEDAVQSLHHSDSAMGAFYRRIKAKHGPAKAITATARKIACLIYRVLR